jgi:DNA-binding NtrC family response regulator
MKKREIIATDKLPLSSAPELEQRSLDDYVDQLEDIFENIEAMLACKDLDSLDRQASRVQMFLLKLAVSELGVFAGEIRDRRAVDEVLPKRVIFLDRRGLEDSLHDVAFHALRANDPLGEELLEPWAGVLERFESNGFTPVRSPVEPWMPRSVLEGDLAPEVEAIFRQVGSVAVIPFLLRDHRPQGAARERLCGMQVLYLREKLEEREAEVARGLGRLKTVGEVVLTNRFTMEGLLKKVATFRRQTKGKILEIQGASEATRALQVQVEEVAGWGATRLRIEGPRGAGKKHVAELFHRLGPGASNPFVAVDCARVAAGREIGGPSDYAFRKKLFGDVHAEDLEDAMGAFEQARGGTLFLDEVESLPLSFQYKLAQVLHENRFSRLGEEGRVQIDCRILLASEAGLADKVEARRFSSKLMRPFRNAPLLRVPGLNERREDIPALVKTFFAKQVRSQKKHRLCSVAPETMRILTRRDWSEGNVKALQNLLGWAVARTGLEDVELLPEHLPSSLRRKDPRWSVEVYDPQGSPRSFEAFVREGFELLETSLGDRRRAFQAWGVHEEEVAKWLP